MVLQVLSNAGKVNDRLDIERIRERLGAYAGKLQSKKSEHGNCDKTESCSQLRRSNGTATIERIGSNSNTRVGRNIPKDNLLVRLDHKRLRASSCSKVLTSRANSQHLANITQSVISAQKSKSDRAKKKLNSPHQ